MKYDRAFFDAHVNRKNTHAVKWDAGFITSEEDLPMWVADWDFQCAEPIVQALKDRAEHPCYGYTCDDPADKQSFCDYWQRHHNVTVQPEQTMMLPCVVTGLKLAVRAFTGAGDGVVIIPPVYGPFRNSIVVNDRVPFEALLTRDENARYQLDFDAVEEQLRRGSKCLMFCNPHNPVSRAWTRKELQKLVDLCNQYGAILLSDEIHADFVYAPNKFISMLTLDGADKCVVALAAASKTFNVPGLQQAMAMSHNADLLKKIAHEAECAGVTSGNTFALPATRAAYTSCDDWRAGMLEYLDESRKIIMEEVPRLLPKAVLSPIEATALCWIDLRAYCDSMDEIMDKLKKHHLILNNGTFFGDMAAGFVRLNFACPHDRLHEGLRRLAAAMND